MRNQIEVGQAIKIVRLKVGAPPEVATIQNSLEATKAEVGGWLEAVFVAEGLFMICDDEGALKKKPVNLHLRGQQIVGDVFFCRIDEDGEMASLTDDDVKLVSAIRKA